MVLWQSVLVFLAFFTVVSGLREALDEEFPFQVIVTTSEQRTCGGAIITARWVLTASACLMGSSSVTVTYGSAKANNGKGTIHSRRIERNSRLALIELDSDIEFSKSAKQAGLPISNVQLRNTTKFSGWKVESLSSPSLWVIDKYLVIEKDCHTITGQLMPLNQDQFCGMNEELQNPLSHPGAIVSKAGIVLGMLPQHSLSPIDPLIFTKLSHHEQWIKDVLGSDAQYVNWVNKVPNSAKSMSAISLALLGISTFFLLQL